MTENQDNKLDANAESTPSATDSTPTTAPSQAEIEYMAFIMKHKARCSMWVKAHGNASFPIVKGLDGFRWLNREARRKMKLKY